MDEKPRHLPKLQLAVDAPSGGILIDGQEVLIEGYSIEDAGEVVGHRLTRQILKLVVLSPLQEATP